jgi:hypothetical protein
VKGDLGRFIAPEGLRDSAQGFNPDLYTQFGETEDTWKEPVGGANNTAYATLLSEVSSDLSKKSWRYLREPTATTRGRKVALASGLYFVRTGERCFSRQTMVALGGPLALIGGLRRGSRRRPFLSEGLSL